MQRKIRLCIQGVFCSLMVGRTHVEFGRRIGVAKFAFKDFEVVWRYVNISRSRENESMRLVFLLANGIVCMLFGSMMLNWNVWMFFVIVVVCDASLASHLPMQVVYRTTSVTTGGVCLLRHQLLKQ